MSGIYRRHWSGDSDRPALALHCMLASGGYWGPIARLLEGRVDLHAFDNPGHGKSDHWAPGPDDPDYHTAVTRIAASFIERPIDLIGHSFGATVALRIAVAAPEAVRSLTLIEPVLFAAAPEAAKTQADLHKLLDQTGEEETTRHFMSEWGVQSYDGLPPEMQEQMRRRIRLVADTGPTLADDSANILREGGLEAIDAPVLIISGADTPGVIHAIADNLAKRLPDVGRATIPNAGHMAPITHPAETAGLIGVNLDRACS